MTQMIFSNGKEQQQKQKTEWRKRGEKKIRWLKMEIEFVLYRVMCNVGRVLHVYTRA